MTAAAARAVPEQPRRYDVCNGDADGLCAVVQWRLHDPRPAVLVTGLKREIALLDRVPAGAADEVLVCDISLQRNRTALLNLLAAGARVRYFDHHAADDIPSHPGLDAHLDFGREVCTSMLVDRCLDGRFRAWAAVGAYGDGLMTAGDRLSDTLGLDVAARASLRRLGEAVNYNAYGDSLADVHIAPAELYAVMARHADPLLMAVREPVVLELDRLREEDFSRAAGIAPLRRQARASVYLLPDAAWSRRVIGPWASELARAYPDQALAVLVTTRGGAYTVSVRAPRAATRSAHAFCARHGGAGRAAAAGIDALPAAGLDRFVMDFMEFDWGAAP